jgi:hypothetical protein
MLPALAVASPMMQVGTIHKDAAPILSSTQSKEVPNSYMIVFKKHVKESHAKEHHDWVQSIHSKSENERMELRKRSQFPVTTEIFDGLKHTYNIIGGMVGYSGHFDDETIEAIRRHPDVSSTPISPFFHCKCDQLWFRGPSHLPVNARRHVVLALAPRPGRGTAGGVSERCSAIRQQSRWMQSLETACELPRRALELWRFPAELPSSSAWLGLSPQPVPNTQSGAIARDAI